MKLVRYLLLVIIVIVLMIGCNNEKQISSEETFGSIKELTEFLPDERAIWTYKGTGNYYHQMVLEDIISSNQSINYKIKAEILSDQNNSDYDDYLTEIRYILSKRGWQQELKKSKLLDSKYKDMYLIKFPIEENNTWREKVLDFENKQRMITAEILAIDYEEDQKMITVKYSEENSDYYEIRKIKEKKGIVEFKQNVMINQERILLEYSLESFNNNEDSLKSEIKGFLVGYNNAWEDYYNNKELEILDYIQKDSVFESSILRFEKNDETEISFIDLSVESIQLDKSQYKVEVDESFNVKKNSRDSIQRNSRIYILISTDNGFRIIKIE